MDDERVGEEVLMPRGVRKLARCTAVFGLVIGVAACGGDSEVGSPATTDATTATNAALPVPDETVIDAEVMATVGVIVDRLGPDPAFAAVVIALDAGYAADQIAQHASVLTPQGTIPDVAPTATPTGVFATANGQGLRRSAEKTPAQALANLQAKAYDRDTVDTLIGTVLSLSGTGYSAEQIIEGLVFGEQRFALAAVDGIERCILLAERDGTVIIPAGPPTLADGRRCAVGIMNRSELLVAIDGNWVEAATPAAPVPETADYRFTAVLDLSDETGTLRYDWAGSFNLDDEGAITGSGSVGGSSAGTCESPGFEGTESGTYAYTVDGTFDIAGSAADDQLEIRLANASAQFSSDQGDRAILCVDITRDIALDIGRLPLGDPELNLGMLTLPASGGSTIIDTGEGIIFTIEVTPT